MRISDWSSDVCSSDLIQKHQVPKIQVIYIHNLNCIYEGPPIVKYSLIPQTGCSSDRCAGLKRRSAIAENSGERSCCNCPNASKDFITSPSRDRKSVEQGKKLSVRVDSGGGRIN